MPGEAKVDIRRKMHHCLDLTRPDTRLPKSRGGGQGPYLRSPDHLGKSSEVEKIKS